MHSTRLNHFKITVRKLIKTFILACLFPCLVCAQTLSFGDEDTSSEAPKNVSAPQKVLFAQPKNDSLPQRNVQIKPVSNAYDQSDKNKGAIKIYMRDFSVSKTVAGYATCSLKLYVESSLPNAISNISFRLKWPKMDAPFSFDDIAPNATVYHGNVFLGDTCYALDVTPNIIVNRCRIKGMSQQDCTNMIEWVK